MSKLLIALRIVLGLLFLAAASAKLFGLPMMVQEFDAIGFGQAFRYVVGLCELVGALLLIRTSTAWIGGGVLACVCTGALVAQLAILHGDPIHAAVLAALAGLIAWHHRPRSPGAAA